MSELPAIASSPLSVLLFAQADCAESADAVRAWRQHLGPLSRPFEIFVIQPANPDNAPPADSNVRVFPYERSQGFRVTLNEAIQVAQYPLLVFSTADKQYQPSDLDRMLAMIDKVHLMIGYRTLGPVPPWRVMLDILMRPFCRIVLGIPLEPRKGWLGSTGWGRRWLARWLFGLRVTDPECPFRLARRSLFERIPIQSGGSFALIEMLAKANHLGAIFAEEPVAWTPSSAPPTDAVSFSADARSVFRRPEFRPSNSASRER